MCLKANITNNNVTFKITKKGKTLGIPIDSFLIRKETKELGDALKWIKILS